MPKRGTPKFSLDTSDAASSTVRRPARSAARARAPSAASQKGKADVGAEAHVDAAVPESMHSEGAAASEKVPAAASYANSSRRLLPQGASASGAPAKAPRGTAHMPGAKADAHRPRAASHRQS